MTQLPPKIRTHVIARYWWCAEQSRLLALYPELSDREPKGCMLGGTRVHDWLEARPKSKSEQALIDKLQDYYPFTRLFEDVTISGTPDDIQIVYFQGKRFVKLSEFKTVSHYKLDPLVTCQASLQVKIYCWILEPILKELGYRLSAVHDVALYNRNSAHYIGKREFHYRSQEVEKELHRIFEMYRGNVPPIPPTPWKCQVCDKELKERCTINVS